MRKISIAILVLLPYVVFSQNVFKKRVGLDDGLKWPSVSHAIISNDGKYVAYTTKAGKDGREQLVVKSVTGNWDLQLPGADVHTIKITDDSKKMLFLNESGSMGVLELGGSVVYKPNVADFKLCTALGRSLLAYSSEKDGTVLTNLSTGVTKSLPSTLNYFFFQNRLAYVKQLVYETDTLQGVFITDLKTSMDRLLWSGKEPAGFLLDENTGRLAFFSEGKIVVCSLKTKEIMTMENPFPEFDFVSFEGFHQQNRGLLVHLRKKEIELPKLDMVSLDVWSYFDGKIQGMQLAERVAGKEYHAIFYPETKKAIRLSDDHERLVSWSGANAIIMKAIGEYNGGDSYWQYKEFIISKVDLKTGVRDTLKDVNSSLLQVSPDGNYILYSNDNNRNLFVYDMSSRRSTNLSAPLSKLDESFLNSDYTARGIASWLGNSPGILLYGSHDLWKIDLSGKDRPMNITSGLGKNSGIVFTLIEDAPATVSSGNELVLTAFNPVTKQNGFYRLNLARSHSIPELLTMGDEVYHVPGNGSFPDGTNDFKPVKAKYANTFLLKRMRSKESPNFFVTQDFKVFNAVSDIHPEREFNWYSAELHEWKSENGKVHQGLMYRPEDFDSAKKYPVLFYFYEKLSDRLNAYLKPNTSGSDLNIPFFVNQGYLVFTPDIHYKEGEPGESALQSVSSAARYVKKLNYVNPDKFGMEGVSWGSYEVNYIVTHSDLFAAACSKVGPSNLSSFFGSLSEVYTGSGNSPWVEIGQGRMKRTPSDDPEAYIRNSPVYYVNDVKTPILMMANKADQKNFIQQVEFFSGLRRAGKIAWMLQYDDGWHGAWGKEGRDFTIRLLQFYDHYLKDKPAPYWMTDGIPANLKGKIDGLQVPDVSKPMPRPLNEKKESINN